MNLSATDDSSDAIYPLLDPNLPKCKSACNAKNLAFLLQKTFPAVHFPSVSFEYRSAKRYQPVFRTNGKPTSLDFEWSNVRAGKTVRYDHKELFSSPRSKRSETNETKDPNYTIEDLDADSRRRLPLYRLCYLCDALPTCRGYAFVEFEDERDAEDAYHDMHGRRVDGYQLTVQWAKNAPSTNWRYDRGGGDGPRRRSPSPRRRGPPPDSRDYGRGRSRSPGRRGGNDGGRRRSPSPPPRRASPPPARNGDNAGDSADATKDGEASGSGAGRYRDEPSPVAANGVGREGSLSPVE